MNFRALSYVYTFAQLDLITSADVNVKRQKQYSIATISRVLSVAKCLHDITTYTDMQLNLKMATTSC